MTSPSARLYRLAAHVHACRAGRHVVLLDLKRDKYLGMDGTDALALRDRVSGLPLAGLEGQTAENRHSTELLTEMLRQGMLTPGAQDGQVSSPPAVQRPERALIDGYVDIRSSTGWRDVASFLIASLTVMALLRFRTLDQILERVRRARRSRAHCALDIERARQRLVIFNRLRPLLYSNRNACLFSSLAAREYLARDGLFPRLVFGVATDPFTAHCWLQAEDVVINDTPEYVREYTPILVV